MKAKQILLAGLVASFGTLANAALVDLTGLGYVTYGDANSYSLAVANYYQCGKEYGPGCAYNVKGSPGAGETDPRLYVVQGANGQASNGNTFIDDAFDAANNQLYFTMTSTNEPDSNKVKNSTFVGDKVGTWDATLSALNSTLNLLQNNMTFFFVNNEPNSNDGLTQSLAVWSRITITNLSGNVTYGIWDLTNDPRTAAERSAGSPAAPGYGPPPIGGGVPNGDVTQYTSEGLAPQISDFVMSGGQVCIDKTTKQLVDCTTAKAGTFDTINHNLGENQAPYAVIVPELNDLIQNLLLDPLADLSQYVFHMDLRYGCVDNPFTIVGNGGNAVCQPGGTAVSQDNNFEQVFISTSTRTNDVPEPKTLALLGLSLVSMAAIRRRMFN